MRKLVLSAVALAVVAVQPALAQDEKVAVQNRGSEAITMGANTNSATIGYWHKLSDKNSIGGDFTFVYRNHDDYDTQRYQLSPGIRHYLLPDKSVSPYLYGAVVATYSNGENEEPNFRSRSESYTAGLQGGVGLEWFPIQRLSIAGHVGLIAQYEKVHSSSSGSGPIVHSSTSTDEGFTVGTISSGILVNLYF